MFYTSCDIRQGVLIMRWSVWIPLSYGGRYRFWVYDSYEKAHNVAVSVGGVVSPIKIGYNLDVDIYESREEVSEPHVTGTTISQRAT